MRINAYLAACKLGSRRKVEEYIISGRVSVNGAIATLGMQVQECDIVLFDGKQVHADGDFVYYVLNKPIGYLCTVSDDRGRPTVLNIVKDREHRVFPVGRLDYNTEGLIILTNDGNFANKVIHPSSNIGKTYEFTTKICPTSAQLNRLAKGVMLEDGLTSKAIVGKPLEHDDLFITKITIFEGKNREVRRMCSAVGLHIVKLRRIAIGNYELGDLPLKKYKKVSISELQAIFD